MLCTACGGNAPENTSAGASLDVVEREEDPTKSLPPAPTDAHLKLARLLPGTKARLNDSITYCGWNAEQAQSYTDEKEGEGAVKAAPLPCARARYSSTGYEVGSDGKNSTARQTYPQVADLYVILAPAPDAAEAIKRKIEDMLAKQQFAKKDSLRVTSGTEGKPGPEISLFLRVDEEADRDKAYVAYVNVTGSTVIYALETEVRMPLKGPKGEVIRLPTGTQMGSRLGGGLIVLVNDKLSR